MSDLKYIVSPDYIIEQVGQRYLALSKHPQKVLSLNKTAYQILSMFIEPNDYTSAYVGWINNLCNENCSNDQFQQDFKESFLSFYNEGIIKEVDAIV